MTSINNQKLNPYQKFKEIFFNSHGYSTRRKFYNSLWSILFGFLLMIIMISIFKYKPFEVVSSFFDDANKAEKFIPTIVTYIFSALAISVCFKAGIFNIGIPGQMMISGFMMLYIIRSEEVEKGMATSGTIMLAMIVAILVSITCSLLLGALKTYLKVNEVVASIMINWIVFFIVRYVVSMNVDNGLLATPDEFGRNLTSSYILPDFFSIPSNGLWYLSSYAWVLIIIAVIAAVLLWVVIRFTKFGYKIKMVGLSQTASEYSGTNKNNLTLITLTISGLLSGIAGIVYYIIDGGSMNIDIKSGPPLVGFNAMAVSLIVFDHPLAIIGSSTIFSLISVGSEINSAFPLLPREMTDVVSGIFIYSAAIAFVFTKFLPYEWSRNFIILIRYKEYRKRYWKNYKEFFIYVGLWFVEKGDLFELWLNNRTKWIEINKKYKTIQKNEEKELSKSLPNNKFNFKKLDHDYQMKYLEFLAKLKKQKDIELAEANYFEKNKIKAVRTSRYTAWKHEYNDVKKEIINNHLHIKEEKLQDTTFELAAKEKERLEKKQKGGKNE